MTNLEFSNIILQESDEVVLGYLEAIHTELTNRYTEMDRENHTIAEALADIVVAEHMLTQELAIEQ